MKKRQIDISRFIGTRLYEARTAAGLARSTLAQKIEISDTQLRKYENGTDQISITKLFLLAEALSLNLNYFLDDIKPVHWNEKITQNQRAVLNISNNFMQIKDKACKKAISSLLVAIVHLNSKEVKNSAL